VIDGITLAQAAQQEAQASASFSINGIIALIAGILVLIFPRILNYVVAIYLIAIGLIEIFDIRIG
jgi:uncharacterized membrane protein HdeD (DUF308 family)